MSQSFESVLNLIDAWDLEGASRRLQEGYFELDQESRNQLEDRLKSARETERGLEAAEALAETDASLALQRLEELREKAFSHPRYDSVFRKAIQAETEEKKARAQGHLDEAKQAIVRRDWPVARQEIGTAKKTFDTWADDPSLSKDLLHAEGQLELREEADRLIAEAHEAHDRDDFGRINEILNTIETRMPELVSEEEKRNLRDQADKSRRRAEGYSTKQEYDDEEANIRASLKAVEAVENWRAALINQQRLNNRFAREGRTGELASGEVMFGEYLTKLQQKVRNAVDAYLEDSGVALKAGRLGQAKRFLEGAVRAGLAPEPKPGETADVAGDITPTTEQDQKIAQLAEEIWEREAARKKVDTHVQTILLCLGSNRRDELEEAKALLNLVAGMDSAYPWQEALEREVDAKLERLVDSEGLRAVTKRAGVL